MKLSMQSHGVYLLRKTSLLGEGCSVSGELSGSTDLRERAGHAP